jgi:hypothetical protein
MLSSRHYVPYPSQTDHVNKPVFLLFERGSNTKGVLLLFTEQPP